MAIPDIWRQGWTDIPFDIPNLRVENGPAKAHVRIGWLRSVANIYHAFAVQCFADELAHLAGRDPFDYLLDLIGPPRILDLNGADYPNYGASYKTYPIDTGRLRRVLELAAEKSGWAKRKPGDGTGWGIAVHRSFVTYVATVVQVEVNAKGELRIPRVDMAVDAGLIVDPMLVRTQFEGAAVFGTSVARSGEITATNGVIDQSNFYDYPVARINEAPFQTNVHIVESSAPPGGVGEPGVPPFIAALCNAIYAATGKRVRELPLSRIDLGREGADSKYHRLPERSDGWTGKNSFSNASADWGTFGACFTIKWIGTVHRPDPLKFRIGSCRSASCENLIEEGKSLMRPANSAPTSRSTRATSQRVCGWSSAAASSGSATVKSGCWQPPRWSGANSAFSF